MKKLILTFLTLTVLSFSQDYTNWQNYFSYNQVNEITGTTNEFWAATDGGAFYYNAADDQFLTMSIVEGLSSSQISTLTADKDGNIWFGTKNGVINIYQSEDKSIDKIFDIFDSDKPEKGINQIVIEGNTAYVSTDFGVSLINTETRNFSDTYRKFGDFDTEIKAYNVLIEDGKLFVSTEKGVAILKDNATNPAAPESWDSYLINALPVYKLVKFKSELIACTDNGLYKFDGNNWNLFQLASTPVKDLVTLDNSLHILTSNKLYKYDTALQEVPLNLKSSKISFNKLLMENESSFLICSDSGVVKNGNIENIIAPNGPLQNSFQGIDVDANGNLFAGNISGIFHLDKTIWRNYNVNNTPGLVLNDMKKVFCAPDGKTYLMSWGGGFSIYENGEITGFNSANTDLDGIANDPDFVVISDIDQDSNDDIWILTYESYTRKNIAVKRQDGEWYYYQLPSFIASLPVPTKEMTIDRFDTKWFIANSRLCYFNNGTTFVNTDDDKWGVYSNGISSKTINCIEIDDRGDLWVGTNSGVFVISQTNNLSSASIKEVLIEAVYRRSITNIEVDALNQKWIVTSEGLVLLSQDGSRVNNAFNSDNSPLPSNNINSLAFENQTGLLYVATDAGLLSYQTTAVEPNKEFSDLSIYPNPFVIGDSQTNIVKIDGLIKDTEIKILSVSGKLVREFQTPGGRIASWDGRDDEGKLVGSGVYIVVAYDKEANNVETGKIAVLRK